MNKKKDQGGDGNIQVYLRIRPSKQSSNYFLIDDLEPDSLSFNLPDSYKSEYINNTKLKHHFNFNGVLDMAASQEDVFKKVGVEAVQNALDGFNSTVFAYGQTGSGKTFTLTGGPERYSDRGIIPRAISTLFQEFRSRSDMQYKCYVSYLEIYMEQGYDLLDPSHETKKLEDLPKVTMLEDEHGNFHLKNLSMHVADTEEDALNLLFMGDTNRAIAETPMNIASSRSHCIFSIAIESRPVGSDKVRRSKLHLVDLAGSERVAKTNSSGSVLQEAKFINGSLFFLEMVIVALYEKATKGRTHVPYRNSMMTSVLRDSLGGNCKTIMIATINPEAAHTEESLSTCRFAQRVSLIKNKATINEDMDPSMVIRRLKAEILELREEIAFLKGEAGEGDILTPQELEDLKNKVRAYSTDMDPHAILNIGTMTLTKIKDAFAIFKNLVLETKAKVSSSSSSLSLSPSRSTGSDEHDTKETAELLKQLNDLKSCLLQRDNEIAILVNMVKKGKTADDVGIASRGNSRATNSVSGADRSIEKSHVNTSDERLKEQVKPQVRNQADTSFAQMQQQQQRERETARDEKIIKRHLFGVPPPTDRVIFDDAAASFEWFRERCPSNSAMEENKEILKQKITEAKTTGERANQSRSTITYLKNSIEAIRRELALQRLDAKRDEADVDDESPEEQTYRRAIEQEKTVYKESFERLRVLKPEIEHIRKILEKGRLSIQNQFDQWYNNLHARENLMASTSAHESFYKEASSLSSNAFTSEESMTTGSRSIAREQNEYKSSYHSSSSIASNSSISTFAADSKDGGDVNDDIMAFYQAKEELLKRKSGNR